nr:reverse transcriptase domain-containing protein [Tanacetum cinerariifolium]
MVNPVNARNPTAARGACFECSGRGNNGNRVRGGAFMLGALGRGGSLGPGHHDGLVPHLVTSENKIIERYVYGLAPQIRGMVTVMELAIIQKVVQKAGTLTDEAIRNGPLKKNTKKRGNGGEPSRDRNVKDDDK